ncbi:putative Protein farnesyltransferase/geranylgeranyltransferase type-1 subunit alpha [Blattamonas nauphoetae]|uniref:Protein farnesyltransferase/geranylgeranyltransferase type-1 subunit alpha n=1 Tax=Blattamonas nauphoetae TaxID=2049346 RepID=A0ABQ9XXM7_9EUKA|nr:putative Protein farnesyltransferase/geranylgeranyltransferase type-1 subunit alpha [Blattamonas nauphoetae]
MESTEQPPAYIPLSQRDEWKDLTPTPLDDGPTPVCAIEYSVEYSDLMGYFRTICKQQEASERALWLTENALKFSPSNYTLWSYRRFVLEQLNSDCRSEFEFLKKMTLRSSKNYQLWFHRQWTVEKTKDTSHEFPIIDGVLQKDAKHFHAWAHRIWMLEQYGGWEQELDYSKRLITEDPFNNSAWNHRFQALSRVSPTDPSLQPVSSSPRRTGLLLDVNVVKSEIEFASTFLKAPEGYWNEAIWNYLRGFYSKTGASYTHEEIPETSILAESIACDHPDNAREAVALLVDVLCEKNQPEHYSEAIQYCSILAEYMDPIRKNYWINRMNKIKQNI